MLRQEKVQAWFGMGCRPVGSECCRVTLEGGCKDGNGLVVLGRVSEIEVLGWADFLWAA